MTAPQDPTNIRPKSRNSSRGSMDIADRIMKEELVANGDGRWRYKPTKDGHRQLDMDIALRAGCNESYVSKERRRLYGHLVPEQSEEVRAAKRGKRPVGFVYPNARAPEPAVIIPQERVDEVQRIMEQIFPYNKMMDRIQELAECQSAAISGLPPVLHMLHDKIKEVEEKQDRVLAGLKQLGFTI